MVWTTMGTTLIVIIAIVVIPVLFIIGTYNRLIGLRNRYKNAFAQIDVQLKRRYDLIPNLIETAKGYMAHERETLEAVVKARNIAAGAASDAAGNPGDPQQMSQLANAESSLKGAMGRLMVVVERYPDLKANQNMLALQEEITSTENKISFARQAFNDAVMVYNTKREVFPAIVFAGMLGFSEAQLFEILDATEREAPKVQF